ncbi:MAG TPA: DUF3006 domain-containing protein [Oscillospiraceae bacterium]|nr:DUF3006 domain-containing protein [Oscillospiraceae bacterium]HXK78189.1 DUF3006 domain-containing protein [Oscillospiraceae bacterium]
MELWILDRFEEDRAVLEGDETTVSVPKETLPENSHPGDCFRSADGGGYVFDAKATAARRERIVALKHKLCGK